MKKVILAVVTSGLMMFSVNAKADPVMALPLLIALQGQLMVKDSQRQDDSFNKPLVVEKASNGNYSFLSTSCEYTKCSN